MTRIYEGGRSKKAPYETEMYRIPSPCKHTVKVIANSYRELVSHERSEDAEAMLSEVEKVAQRDMFTDAGIEEKLIAKIQEYLSEKGLEDTPGTRNWTEFKRFIEWLNRPF